MIKECAVKLNNNYVTVVVYENIEIQFPAIHKSVDTVYVKSENDRYSIVDDMEETVIDEKPKRKSASKKTTIEKSEENAE